MATRSDSPKTPPRVGEGSVPSLSMESPNVSRGRSNQRSGAHHFGGGAGGGGAAAAGLSLRESLRLVSTAGAGRLSVVGALRGDAVATEAEAVSSACSAPNPSASTTGHDATFIASAPPVGQHLLVNVLANYGDPLHAGLCRLQVIDTAGACVPIAPADVFYVVAPRNEAGGSAATIAENSADDTSADPRRNLAALLSHDSGHTTDETQMWIGDMEPPRTGRSNRAHGCCDRLLCLAFPAPVSIGALRFVNYRGERSHRLRGVRSVDVTLDDAPVFRGGLRSAGLDGDDDDGTEVVFFSEAPAVVAAAARLHAGFLRHASSSDAAGQARPQAARAPRAFPPPSSEAPTDAPAAAVGRSGGAGLLGGAAVQAVLAIVDATWGGAGGFAGLSGVRLLRADGSAVPASDVAKCGWVRWDDGAGASPEAAAAAIDGCNDDCGALLGSNTSDVGCVAAVRADDKSGAAWRLALCVVLRRATLLAGVEVANLTSAGAAASAGGCDTFNGVKLLRVLCRRWEPTTAATAATTTAAAFEPAGLPGDEGVAVVRKAPEGPRPARFERVAGAAAFGGGGPARGLGCSLTASASLFAKLAIRRVRLAAVPRPAWLEQRQPYAAPLLPVAYCFTVRLDGPPSAAVPTVAPYTAALFDEDGAALPAEGPPPSSQVAPAVPSEGGGWRQETHFEFPTPLALSVVRLALTGGAAGMAGAVPTDGSGSGGGGGGEDGGGAMPVGVRLRLCCDDQPVFDWTAPSWDGTCVFFTTDEEVLRRFAPAGVTW